MKIDFNDIILLVLIVGAIVSGLMGNQTVCDSCSLAAVLFFLFM